MQIPAGTVSPSLCRIPRAEAFPPQIFPVFSRVSSIGMSHLPVTNPLSIKNVRPEWKKAWINQKTSDYDKSQSE